MLEELCKISIKLMLFVIENINDFSDLDINNLTIAVDNIQKVIERNRK